MSFMMARLISYFLGFFFDSCSEKEALALVQLTFDVLKVQIHGVLADVVSEQLYHVRHPLRNDGWLVPALPTGLD